jgi:hypothetical protein
MSAEPHSTAARPIPLRERLIFALDVPRDAADPRRAAAEIQAEIASVVG